MQRESSEGVKQGIIVAAKMAVSPTQTSGCGKRLMTKAVSMPKDNITRLSNVEQESLWEEISEELSTKAMGQVVSR